MNQQDEIIRQLYQEKQRLDTIVNETSKRLASAPVGYVRADKCGSLMQFYHRTDPKDKVGKYIPVREKKKVRALIQKRYDMKLQAAARKQLKAVELFLSRYDPCGIDNAYYGINPELRKYLISSEMPDEVFAEKWQAEPYEPKRITEETPKHFTQKEEPVRSKSEVIIANALFNAKVPYRYEYPLFLEDRLIYPDFTILRKRDRKIVYWEHLGMMDEPEYRNDAFARIRAYERKGIYIGDRLLITMETYRQPLNLAFVNSLIRHYFLD